MNQNPQNSKRQEKILGILEGLMNHPLFQDLILELADSIRVPANKLTIEELFIEIPGLKTRHPALLALFRLILEEETVLWDYDKEKYKNSPLDALAAKLGVCTSTIGDYLRDHTNSHLTFDVAIRRILLHIARKKLIAEPFQKIEDIAYLIGFAPSLLTRRFSEEFGLTPTAFKRMSWKENEVRNKKVTFSKNKISRQTNRLTNNKGENHV